MLLELIDPMETRLMLMGAQSLFFCQWSLLLALLLCRRESTSIGRVIRNDDGMQDGTLNQTHGARNAER